MTRPIKRIAAALLASTALCGPAAAQQLGAGPMTPNGAAGLQSSAVVYADLQFGGDWCARINAAINLLPSTGGVVDARGLTGAQSCAGGLTLPSNVIVFAGAATVTQSAGITMSDNSALICLSSGSGIGYVGSTGGPSIFKQANGANLPIQILDNGGKTNISNCVLDGNKANNTTGSAVLEITSSHGLLDSVTVQNGVLDNIAFMSSPAANTTSSWQIRNLTSIDAGGRALFCYSGADTMVEQSHFEFSGGPGVELDNCNGWRFDNYDIGGNGVTGVNGLGGVNTASTAPQLYIHGQIPVGGLYTGASGEIFGAGQFGNGYAQDILIDGSSPTELGAVGGTITTSDVITITFSGSRLNGGTAVNVTYTVQSTDTATTIAAALGTAINANATLTAYEIMASAALSNVTAYLPAHLQTISSAGAAPTATDVTVSSSVSGAGTETIGWTANNAGGASYKNQFTNPQFLGSSYNAANLFYQFEVYNSASGGNLLAGTTAGSTSAHAYAGLFDVHGATAALTGWDVFEGLTANGTYTTPQTVESLFVGAGTNTNIRSACAPSLTACYNAGQNTFTSFASGKIALTAITQGAGGTDMYGLEIWNPAPLATYPTANVEFDMTLGASPGYVVGALHAQDENNSKIGRVSLLGANTSGTLIPLFFAEANAPSLSGCSFGTPSSSQPQFIASLSAACSATNVVVTFKETATDGWVCGPAIDRNTGVAYYQTSDSTTTATFKSVTGSNADVFQFGPCAPY